MGKMVKVKGKKNTIYAHKKSGERCGECNVGVAQILSFQHVNFKYGFMLGIIWGGQW